MTAILKSGRLFFPEVALEVEYNHLIAGAFPYILSFWSML